MRYNNVEVVSFKEYEEKNFLRPKKCNDTFRMRPNDFVEGVDYFKPARREVGYTRSNPQAPIYLLTKSGQEKMKEYCSKRKNAKVVSEKETMEKQKPTIVPVSTELSTQEILLQMLESQKVFQETMLKSFQTMANLLVNMNTPKAETILTEAEPTKPVEIELDSFDKYNVEITALMDKVMKNSGFRNRNNLKQLVKTKLNKDYGLCTSQTNRDFYNQEGRYPKSDIELFWWIEQNNANLRGLVSGILGTFLTLSTPKFPVKNVEDLKLGLEYIANKTKDTSMNHANTYRQFFDYVSAHEDIKWEKFENKIRRKYHRSAIAKVTKLECLECKTIREKSIVQFNNYVEEKYKQMFS